MHGKFLFLGTSGSMGVPVIACKCSVCLSSSHYNKRKRCSALITVVDRHLLIDAGPEIREQLISRSINKLDGALLTHPHFDHIAGVDDLKAFFFAEKIKLPILLSKETFDEIRHRHYYLIDESRGKPEGFHFDFHILEDRFGKVDFAGLFFEYLTYTQSKMPVTGLKIGNLAYISDLKEYTKELIDAITDIDVLIISALRQTISPMHLSIDEAIAFAKKVSAKKTYFTHMAHDVDYERDTPLLPEGIQFAYDGLEIPFHYDQGKL